ncbi:MAG: glycosyltransferase family 4 protein [Gemmatimonadaceae bacterium]|nr:glycosyltransferase family 4 protein [Gemmatimonadaceae bacterium]
MLIGVDATCWANIRGYGRFARELMRAMAPLAPSDTFACFGDRRSFEAFPDALPNVQRIEVALDESPTRAAAAASSRSPRDLLRLTRAVARVRPDVFFSPSVYTYFPLPPRLPAVVTIHDTIPERFPHLTLPSLRARLFWALKVRVALSQARVVLTVSEYSARSIAAVLRVDPGRIRVAVEAPAVAYRPCAPAEVSEAARRLGLPPDARWFAYVGGFNPHKRVDLILRAHASLSRAHGADPPHLLLVGSRDADVFHQEVGRLDAIVARAGTGSLVHWCGFVPDDELRPLLAGAVASLLPSEAEGFGLPAVEAAACATPVIATTESPLPELLAGGGIFVAPGDASALEQAMGALLTDRARRDALGTAAHARATALSWREAARATLDAIQDAASR